VERLRESGLPVYLLDWRRPEPSDASLGLEAYAGDALRDSLDVIEAETGAARAFLVGHSLGGTLAAIFAARHPQRAAGLVALEAPIAFGEGRFEAAAAGGPSPRAITGALGNVPGSFLDLASVGADPGAFVREPLTDAMATGSSPLGRLHWQVRRWTLDESPMAARLFEEVYQALYRENRFAERRLTLEGASADPQAIECPILAVLDRRSRIVPPSSIEAYRTCTGARRVELLDYTGDAGVVMQHLGVLVGRNAHERLWPRIVDWLRVEASALG
jgi:polyhydroxyalkanoate synthase